MTPKPWSHSALGTFKNCPRQFYELRVAKSVEDTQGEAAIWGTQVHEHFEHRLADGVELPADLAVHEKFLAWLESMPGDAYVEDRIALDTKLQPCAFFGAHDVWYRGVIDYMKVHGNIARIVDHKTGKKKDDFGQLKLFALHTFIRFPQVETVRADYYWTQTMTTSGQTYTRDQQEALWAEFLPDLRQYAEAFRTDVWQPRQSGLCNGWCPVTACEFWRPKRQRN